MKPRRPAWNQPTQGKTTCKHCRKVSFTTKDKAWAAALRVSRHVGPVRAYKCPEGQGWHLTKRKSWTPR